ncbi:hypothetical protein HY624_01520 [Candidatus Uhrbacteria bacterium]|nr:hypothetical protein [Candidatus Uhrbacteria bacterium]
MAQSYIKFFKEISKKDVHIAGGKGASLGEMTQAGIPVPPGFVLTAAAFDRFIEETDLDVEIEAILNKVNYKDVNSVDRASNVIRDLIHDERMPKDLQTDILGAFKQLKAKEVAVRSSATAEDSSQASWAGELETYLNSTEKNVIGNVKKCWSSLFTPRAIFYRNEKGMRKTKVSVAVVVQAMIQSEISGVMFTVHPVTKDRNQMIIEAAWGLGEALVSGQVTPDSYVVSKRDWSLIDVSVAEQARMIARKTLGTGVEWKPVPKKDAPKQKLNGKEIVIIAQIGKKIEEHYGKPEDIEWAYAKKKFYIVQSRPITTL